VEKKKNLILSTSAPVFFYCRFWTIFPRNSFNEWKNRRSHFCGLIYLVMIIKFPMTEYEEVTFSNYT